MAKLSAHGRNELWRIELEHFLYAGMSDGHLLARMKLTNQATSWKDRGKKDLDEQKRYLLGAGGKEITKR